MNHGMRIILDCHGASNAKRPPYILPTTPSHEIAQGQTLPWHPVPPRPLLQPRLGMVERAMRFSEHAPTTPRDTRPNEPCQPRKIDDVIQTPHMRLTQCRRHASAMSRQTSGDHQSSHVRGAVQCPCRRSRDHLTFWLSAAATRRAPRCNLSARGGCVGAAP